MNAGWPANSRKGSLWTSNSQYYMPGTNPLPQATKGDTGREPQIGLDRRIGLLDTKEGAGGDASGGRLGERRMGEAGSPPWQAKMEPG